jgi:hypothetical protein
MLQAGRLRVRVLMRPLETQPLTEMSTSNLPGGRGRPAREAKNFTAICEPIVYKMWEPRRLKPYGPPRSLTVVPLPFNIFRWKLNLQSYAYGPLLGFCERSNGHQLFIKG